MGRGSTPAARMLQSLRVRTNQSLNAVQQLSYTIRTICYAHLFLRGAFDRQSFALNYWDMCRSHCKSLIAARKRGLTCLQMQLPYVLFTPLMDYQRCVPREGLKQESKQLNRHRQHSKESMTNISRTRSKHIVNQPNVAAELNW